MITGSTGTDTLPAPGPGPSPSALLSPGSGRVVALGASNLTRGLLSVTETARATQGKGVEVLAALGHGRSYGLRSRFAIRDLPAILDCGLWAALSARPPRPTRAVITDVGNDILYGASAEAILGWVDEAAARLLRVTEDVALAGLPLDSIRALREPAYLLVRSVLFPPCRLSLREVRALAEVVAEGLLTIVERRNLRFVPLRSEWYGLDPIHFRPAAWDAAWAAILGWPVRPRRSGMELLEALRLYALPAEAQWILGNPLRRVQTGHPLRGGGRLFLF